jgi:hypothetical protein
MFLLDLFYCVFGGFVTGRVKKKRDKKIAKKLSQPPNKAITWATYLHRLFFFLPRRPLIRGAAMYLPMAIANAAWQLFT